MLYKFKSKASGDVIMMGPNGDMMLSLIGHAPAAKGIIEPDAMPAAIAALQRAIADDEAQGRQPDDDSADAAPAGGGDAISLRRRLWPMIDMLQRAQAAGEPVVWGV